MKKLKKFAIILGALSVLILPLASTTGVYADPGTGDQQQTVSEDSFFFGLKPWYSGLTIGSGTNRRLRCAQDNPVKAADGQEQCMSLMSFIWTAVSNVAIDLSVIAAFGAVIFVLYGGYMYMFSGGDASKIATGKKSIANALIGLAIAMLAKVIFTTIKTVLLSSGSDAGATEVVINGTSYSYNFVNVTNPGLVATETIQWIGGVAGVICVIFIVFGGILYITSAGDASKAKKARDTLLYAVVGLAIVALSEAITALVANAIRDAQNNNQTSSLIKEVNEKQIS